MDDFGNAVMDFVPRSIACELVLKQFIFCGMVDPYTMHYMHPLMATP